MNIRSILIVLVVAAQGFNCSQKKPGSGGILSYNKMKLVMWDIAQADEYASVYMLRDTTVKNRVHATNQLYQRVFKLHNTDSAHFFGSFDYYKKHPTEYKTLLDSLYAYSNRERENRFYINRVK